MVVLHDNDLMRIAGGNKNIWEAHYDEIKDLDVGSWFAPEFAGERLQLLQKPSTQPREDQLMVELKYNGHDQKRLNEPSRSLRRKTSRHKPSSTR